MFGWHYVSVSSYCGGHHYLRRARTSATGDLYAELSAGSLLFLEPDGKADRRPYRWRALTWAPEVKIISKEAQNA